MKTIPPPCPHPETGPKYWSSLDDLAKTPEFRGWVEREFPAGASEFSDPASRRKFIQLMASSFMLAGLGLTGCRRPEEHMVPFTRLPENYTHGVFQFYATARPTRQGAVPLLAKVHEGRPIKVDGNPDVAGQNGGTDAQTQASILDLYDVDRAKRFLKGGKDPVAPEAAFSLLSQVARKFEQNKGAGLAFLQEPHVSESRHRVEKLLRDKFPLAKWHSHEPLGLGIHAAAASAAFGQAVTPSYRFEKASVIVSLDCDFLGAEEGSNQHIQGFAQGRKLRKSTDSMSRLYVVEALMTLTGGNADHRLRVPSSVVGQKAAELAQVVLEQKSTQDRWIAALAEDLRKPENKGKVLVVAGHRQPREVHLLAHAINHALGAVGETLLLLPTKSHPQGTLSELATALNAGQVDTLVIVDGNPAYTASADLNWAAAQKKAANVVRLAQEEDETTEFTTLQVPAAHYLESWGDARMADGTIVSIQPLIEPLFSGVPVLEFLARVGGLPSVDSRAIVRETFNGYAPDTSDNGWKQFLHDGHLPKTAHQPMPGVFNASLLPEALKTVLGAPAPSKDSLEVVFHRDLSVDDGRFNNNGWLQELPDPVTKMTWENVILMSEATATAHNLVIVDHEDNRLYVPSVKITLGTRSVEGPAWIQPGMADNVIGLALGYGRTKSGRVGVGSGHNAYAIRESGAEQFALGAKLTPTGRDHLLATTQNHWRMEGRPIIREANLDQYRQHPEFAKALNFEAPINESLYENPLDAHKKDPTIKHQWGMSIDLNMCVGCSACVVACQSENNIPIVGKDQVRRNREMHWLRLDRYYTGNVADPQVVNQPMLCQHCEAAPCENVCPVNATVHDEEGLNLMVYNRCVGTRYCSNNCPYKIRRFNFLDYNRRPLSELKGPFYQSPMTSSTDGEWDIVRWFKSPENLTHKTEEEWELLKLVKNPDVSVRMRGVMEKCTFCVQRIEGAKIAQKLKARDTDHVEVPDRAVRTACEQACPAGAITFGNTKDPHSAVSAEKSNERTYQVLDFLLTKPRVTYQARVRNPNPAMPDHKAMPESLSEYVEKNGSHGDPLEKHGQHGAEAGGGHGAGAAHGAEKKGAH